MNKFIIPFVIVVTSVVLAACVSTFDATSLHSKVGIGKNASVTAVPDSTNIIVHE